MRATRLAGRMAMAAVLVALAAGGARAQAPRPGGDPVRAERAGRCGLGPMETMRRNPRAWELRCLFGASGPGRFGLLSYMDVPVYQPVTALPGTHVVGIPGLPAPAPGESHEAWEWRMLRAIHGADVRTVHRAIELMDPVAASKLLRFEGLLRRAGIPVRRRETWRSPQRQAWIFQQGRSRPGPFATTTLTSWHCRVDRLGRPASRAADYDVSPRHLPRFHALAAEVGLESYGADSNDPGHVFYVGQEWLSPAELAVMRLLPRVPHVTLATGRPDDERPTPLEVAAFRVRSLEWTSSPLAPVPVLFPVALEQPPPSLRAPAPRALPPAPAPVRRGRGRRRG